MSDSIELVIYQVPPSLNRALRLHWAARRRLANRWMKLIWIARCQVHPGAVTTPTTARVCIERYARRDLDRDNLFGSYKPVVDCLKKQGLIFDDCSAYCDLQLTQYRSSKPRTVIRVQAT